jgi:hypothetical protein
MVRIRSVEICVLKYLDATMDSVRGSDYEDFWQSPTALQKLERDRAEQKQRDAKAWQRNIVGLLIVMMLGAGCVFFPR